MPFWRHEETPDGDLWLIAGLGNPGGQYAGTRHNIGFMAAERLASRANLRFKSSKQRADVARGSVEGTPALIALPLTYMNESGNAVSRLLGYYHIPLGRLLVICDDLDLPFGTIRLRPGGSAGGQGGLKSIIRSVGSEEFARLRVGVGRPAGDAIPHVLGRFPPEQARVLPALLDIAADAATAVLREGTAAAMNRYNRDWLPDLIPA